VTTVRPARPEEFALLGPIEREATQRFIEIGVPLAASVTTAEGGGIPLAVFVAGEPPVGFLWMTLVGGMPHVEEVAVLRSAGRRGIGRSLLEAGCRWAEAAGYEGITLCTFRDVPWNGPFYRSAGFVELEAAAWSAELVSIRQHERDNGLDEAGARIVMVRRLSPPVATENTR
jgi:GNAT superfamily N-acetyltransferase